MRTRFDNEEAALRGSANDAQVFLTQLQEANCWFRFKADPAGRITDIAWAHEEQQRNALRYHSVIIQDNTFNTNL